MKLQKTDDGNLMFHLSKREKLMLCQLLDRYPLIPESYHFDKHKHASSEAGEASHKLMEEALAEHRQENKRQLRSMLEDPHRFARAGNNGWHLRLSPAETDWLLQVLNDVRVGSWIQLGSPDPKSSTHLELNADTAPNFWSMELCGHFQAVLIEALRGRP